MKIGKVDFEPVKHVSGSFHPQAEPIKAVDYLTSLQPASLLNYAPFRWISSICHWIWEHVCCCGRTARKLEHRLEQLKTAAESFYANKDSMADAEFRLWWKETFEGFDPEIQKMILLRNVCVYADSLEVLEEAGFDSAEEWAEKNYFAKEAVSRNFVIELEKDTSQLQYDPLKNVPSYMDDVRGILISMSVNG